MELNTSALADLPDEALYHLLLVCSPGQVGKWRQVLGKQRERVFQDAEKAIAARHGLPGLSLLAIHQITSLKDKHQSAKLALGYGDYPEYIESIFDKIGFRRDVFLYALHKKRPYSAIIFLRKEYTNVTFQSVIKNRCEVCLRYVADSRDFLWELLEYFDDYAEYGFLTDNDILWALEIVQPEIKAGFISLILDKEISEDLLLGFLRWTSDEEVKKAYEEYMEDVNNGRPRDVEVIAIFRERLD